MSTTKLANIFALSTLAILLCSFAPSQTLAVAVQANHLARQVPNHHGIARKKRSKRDGQCKPRSSTSPPADQPTSTPADQPTSTPQSSPSPNNSPSPSSTQPPNTVATNTPSTSSGNKFCVAWAMADDTRLNLINAYGRINRVLLWDASVPDLVLQLGLSVSIMLWDDSDQRVNAFEQAVQTVNFQEVRGFNEVNEPTQANMPVDRAVTAWRTYIKPQGDKGIKLSSPCTTSAPNGLDWMKQFYSECPDCGSDTISIHYYDTTVDGFETYAELWHDTFGKDLLLSEFACQNFNGGDQPSIDQIWVFAEGVVGFVESTSWMDGHAPFGFMDSLYNVNSGNALFDGNNGLTDLGKYYASN